MKKYFKFFVTACFVALMLSSCATTSKQAKAKLTKTQSRAFWKIEGTDVNGNPSVVYIQGTFHLGDERIYPLSEEVQKAFMSADRYAGELSTQSYVDLATISPSLAAPNKDGKLVTDYLTEEENAFMQMAFAENLPLVATLEPWQSTTALGIALYVNSGLSAEYGLDNSFVATLSQSGVAWEGLDDLQVQLDIITFGDYDTQIQMLKDTIKSLTDENANAELIESTVSLYDYYVADDMKKMANLFKEENDDEEEAAEFYNEYHKLVYTDRNEEWAQDITDYLAQGGTTFIFAGTAHWIGDESVFTFLKKMGTIK